MIIASIIKILLSNCWRDGKQEIEFYKNLKSQGFLSISLRVFFAARSHGVLVIDIVCLVVNALVILETRLKILAIF